MSGIDLESKFPEMTPVESMPSLGSINGIGNFLYGSRDHDAETGSYVTTHVFCLVFFPVWSWGSYRVIPSGNQFYMLGREPLGVVPKVWNCLMIMALLGGGGWFAWDQYLNSPEAKAGQLLAQGDAAAKSGAVVEAAHAYREVALGRTGRVADGRARLIALFDEALPAAKPDDAATVCDQCAVMVEGELLTMPDLLERGVKLADQHAKADPRGAAKILEAVARLAKDPAELGARRQALWEAVLKANPGDVEAASQLAVALEAQGQIDKCGPLLEPLVDKLAGTEGARILGRLYARSGKCDEACKLLEPYVADRMTRFHAADQRYNQLAERLQNEAIERLKNDKAPKEWYQRAASASEEERNKMVMDYVTEALRADRGLLDAQAALTKESAVVPVALDLGMALLDRARNQDDPAARKESLEKAEKAFTSVQSVAGESDQFKMFLGQVYYWLGKQDEGKKLFDQALENNGRTHQMLLLVCNSLREVGLVADARKLAEEAHDKGNPEEKFEAAGTRSTMAKDLDDKILWLGRCDTKNQHVKADLAAAQGQKAIQENREDEAIRHLRESARIYADMPETATTLNNGSIAYNALFRVTGAEEDFQKGLQMLERANALEPRDSILLLNLSQGTLDSAVRKALAGRIDLKTLKQGGDLDLLEYLYDDQAGREQVVGPLRSDPGISKSIERYDRLLVMSPKQRDVYRALSEMHVTLRNVDAQRALLARARENQPDVTQQVQETNEYYQGTRMAKVQQDIKDATPRVEAILAKAREVGGPTLAVAAVQASSFHYSRAAVGLPADFNAAVQLVEEAQKAAPSLAVRSALISALLARASADLAKKDRQYAQQARQLARAMAGTTLLAHLMRQPSAFAEQAAQHPDVVRAGALVAETHRKFPAQCSTYDWVLARGIVRGEAEAIGKATLGNEVEAVDLELDEILSPNNATLILTRSWRLELAGQDQVAKDLLAKQTKAGVPLP